MIVAADRSRLMSLLNRLIDLTPVSRDDQVSGRHDLLLLWDDRMMKLQGRPKAQRCVVQAELEILLGKRQLAQSLGQYELYYPQTVMQVIHEKLLCDVLVSKLSPPETSSRVHRRLVGVHCRLLRYLRPCSVSDH
jgi:hypothetical protein